jgi:uncharacterized protein
MSDARALERQGFQHPAIVGRARLCALTRERKDESALLRFVAGPDGELVPDIRAKLPGRGVWITANRAALERAVANRVLHRGLKSELRIAADISAVVDRLLETHAIEALSLANKAGCVIAGFERVSLAIAKGVRGKPLFVLLHATDAGADGVRKLEGKWGARWIPDSQAADPEPSLACFSVPQMSLALGRPNVVHAALIEAAPSKLFVSRTRRLLVFRRATTSSQSDAGAEGPRWAQRPTKGRYEQE